MIDPQIEEQLRQGFKYFNRFMLFMWRLGLGKWFNIWPEFSGQVMVINHTGRKSGLRRQTPVNYAEVDGMIYCTAGFGQVSDWYRNILANPEVELWLPDGRWRCTAVDVSEDPERLSLLRQVLIGSGFAAPLFGLHPKSMTGEELAEITVDYRLIRFQRETAVGGADGPGDLVWLWPVLGALALLLLIKGLRKKVS